MRYFTVPTRHLICAIPVLSILVSRAAFACGQTCAATDCWELREPITIDGNTGFTRDSAVAPQIHKDPFIVDKWYQLPHIPTDSTKDASVKFF